ncbi:M23 family metallopeptidase [Paenibacillus sp. LHD-117]|uniref:M23 family metallopeptidase n=1 Tax=Paenibacillus sp. LHD-117 TaxID=3071412 RepID=UPI0027E1594C|nr:M23 family metallopeptidase [Paenibacillus sp. LHD-117]MDQ6422638.1 M23 family metallopeptidase [Paenibacillus sp. LHD-117]
MKGIINRWISRITLLVGLKVVLIMGIALLLIVLISSAFSIISGKAAISQFLNKGDQDEDIQYDLISESWMDKVSWTDPASGQRQTGLNSEMRQQLKEAEIGDYKGLLWVFGQVEDPCELECVGKLAEVLEPKEVKIEYFDVVTETTTVTTTTKIKPPAPSTSPTNTNDKESGSDTKPTVTSESSTTTTKKAFITSLVTYNGLHSFKYMNKKTTSTSTSSSQTESEQKEVVTTTVTTTPMLLSVEREIDYAMLYEAMKEVRMDEEDENEFRFVLNQALAYDPNFYDDGLFEEGQSEVDRSGQIIDVPADTLLAWPVPSLKKISSHFGMRVHPITGERRLHSGMDIPAPKGTDVIAADEGVVIRANYNSISGNNIKIQHPSGYITWYMHLSKTYVKEDDSVKRGEVIGAVGSTGRSTGPHLHFEVFEPGAANSTNPIPFFKGGEE